MNMPVPVVGTDAGPDWANNINASLSIVDSHNHTSGQGAPITSAGLNINTDLPFNNNNATTLRTLRFQSQSATPSQPADLGCLFENGVDLYYTDGNGNVIRFTQSGALAGAAGTITGLPSGTASASFAAGAFIFQSATNTSAVIDGGSVILRNNTASSKGLTLAPPNAMAADYGLTLPALPAATNLMALDTSGNITAPYTFLPSDNYVPVVKFGTTVATVSITIARFTSINKWVMGYTKFQITNLNGGTGNMSFTLPVTGQYTDPGLIPGGAWNSTGDTATYQCMVNLGVSASAPVVAANRTGGGGFGSMENLTAAAVSVGDIFYLSFSYQSV
jgi:hypothetical protein